MWLKGNFEHLNMVETYSSLHPLHPLLFRKVLTLGVVVGSLNACVAGLVPLHLPHLFTNSAEITAGMRSLIPLLSWSLLTHACVMGLEGILLARRRLSFLAGYATFCLPCC